LRYAQSTSRQRGIRVQVAANARSTASFCARAIAWSQPHGALEQQSAALGQYTMHSSDDVQAVGSAAGAGGGASIEIAASIETGAGAGSLGARDFELHATTPITTTQLQRMRRSYD